MGQQMCAGISRIADEFGIPVHVLGTGSENLPAGSLVFVHAVDEGAVRRLENPEALAAHSHPLIDDRLLKATLLLEDVSSRTGLGAISTSHSQQDLERTLQGYRAAFQRFKTAGIA